MHRPAVDQRQVIASRAHGHIALTQAPLESNTVILDGAAAGDMRPTLDSVHRLLVDALAHEDRKTAFAAMVAVDHLYNTFGVAAAALLAAAFTAPEEGDVRRIVIEQLAGEVLFAFIKQVAG